MPTSTKLAIATMNDTSLANEISIRDLQLSRRSQGSLIDDLQRASREHWDRIQHQARQIHDLTQRLERLEKPEPQDTLNRRLKALDAKVLEGGLTCEESDERTWLVKRISLMMGLAVESSGYDELEEAHKYLDALGVTRQGRAGKLLLQGRIDAMRGCELSKWRDAKTDPPKADGYYIAAFNNMFGPVLVKGMHHNGTHWLYTDTGTAMDDNAISHWQELPAPPQVTEPA